MNEKEIRAALEQIEPADGAQERMYQNILKKAAAPKKLRNLLGSAMLRWRRVWYWSVRPVSSRCAAKKVRRFKRSPQTRSFLSRQ